MKFAQIIFACTLAVVLAIGIPLLLNKATNSYAAPMGDFVINSTADAVDTSPGDGVCETSQGKCTLRAAIQESNVSPGTETIFIPSGVYTRTIGGVGGDASFGDLNITNDVNIVGEGIDTTVVNANLLDRVFYVGNMAHANISKITISRGSTPGSGAGIYIEGGASAAINNVAVIGNIGGSGGIEARGSLTVINSLIAENKALNGSSGGGILGFNTTIKILNSTIRDNTTTSRGAGIFIQEPGSAELINVTISGNQSTGEGGGITNLGMKLTMVNVTVSGNHAVWGGAGIDNHGIITTTNVTIFNNQSTHNAGGLYNNPINNGSIKVKNTIIAGNGGGDCGGTISKIDSFGNNIISDTTCNFNKSGDLSSTDPLLGPLQNNGNSTRTHALLSNSPAIDHGDNLYCPYLDQRGFPRPIDGNKDKQSVCDIGAVEVGSFVAIDNPKVVEGNSGEISATFTISLTEIISQNVTVMYHTESDLAISSIDFVPYTGTLEFSTGQTTRTISIMVKGDTEKETDESFFVHLDFVDLRGICTILDDDRLIFVYLPIVKKE